MSTTQNTPQDQLELREHVSKKPVYLAGGVLGGFAALSVGLLGGYALSQDDPESVVVDQVADTETEQADEADRNTTVTVTEHRETVTVPDTPEGDEFEPTEGGSDEDRTEPTDPNHRTPHPGRAGATPHDTTTDMTAPQGGTSSDSLATVPDAGASGAGGSAGTGYGAPGELYVIQWGDTLSMLALQRGTTVDKLVQANGIVNPDLIYAGNTLVIPAS